ncbi:MAG: hypothetical protein ACRDQH_01370 [Pseudonocardiaceae bacterium]
MMISIRDPQYREDQIQLIAAKKSAQRHLTPAIAQLVACEIDFYIGRTWPGLPKFIRDMMIELNDMDLEKEWSGRYELTTAGDRAIRKWS